MVNDTPSAVIPGDPASPGTARGQAVLFNVPHGEYQDVSIIQSDDVTSGDIVVTPIILPQMLDDVKPAAGYVIYNEYGLTSRGAVKARELEIPCVVGCPETIFSVRAGDTVEVDASSGMVKVY